MDREQRRWRDFDAASDRYPEGNQSESNDLHEYHSSIYVFSSVLAENSPRQASLAFPSIMKLFETRKCLVGGSKFFQYRYFALRRSHIAKLPFISARQLFVFFLIPLKSFPVNYSSMDFQIAAINFVTILDEWNSINRSVTER
jgi:hypothetical protein